MNDISKIMLICVIGMGISLICSYLVDWTVNRNMFSMISMWFMFLYLGLLAGEELREKER